MKKKKSKPFTPEELWKFAVDVKENFEKISDCLKLHKTHLDQQGEFLMSVYQLIRGDEKYADQVREIEKRHFTNH